MEGTVTTPALDYFPTFLFGTHFFFQISSHVSVELLLGNSACDLFFAAACEETAADSPQRRNKETDSGPLASDERKPWINHLITLQWLLEQQQPSRGLLCDARTPLHSYNSSPHESNLIYCTCSKESRLFSRPFIGNRCSLFIRKTEVESKKKETTHFPNTSYCQRVCTQSGYISWSTPTFNVVIALPAIVLYIHTAAIFPIGLWKAG